MASDAHVPVFPTLPTERLVLRPVRADDVDALHARRNDPSTAEWQSWALPYPMAAARELIDAMVAQGPAPATEGWFQISIDDAATGEVIGDLALHLSNNARTAEIGYTFAPEARGRGHATEAAAALVRWCFEAVGVSRVCARMHPDNQASARVAEQVGMVFEGHTRKSFWLDRPDGSADNSDDLIYGMTDDDWRAWIDRPREPPTDVRLLPIDRTNVHPVIELATHRTQLDLVATNAQSIADAYATAADPSREAWPRAIEADGTLVGFVMASPPNDDRSHAYLWRLMVDRRHQRRGIGRLAVDRVIDWARSTGAPAIEVSWVPGPGSPEPLYRRAGFTPTGQMHDGEVIGRLEL